MNWQDIREKYPNQIVLIKILKSHIIIDRYSKDIQVVDDFEFIKVLNSPEEVNESLKSKEFTPCSTRNIKLQFEVVYNYSIFKVE